MAKSVTFTRSISYNLDEVANLIMEMYATEEGYVVSEQECLDYAYEWAHENFGCEWGHTFTGNLEMEVTEYE